MLIFFLVIVGCSIGTTQTSIVVIDTVIGKAYEAQPGWQEWVTVIECVSVTGAKIPPYIIFKGQHLMSSWFEGTTLPAGWKFVANAYRMDE